MAEAQGAHSRHSTEWTVNVKRDLQPFLEARESRRPPRPISKVRPRVREPNREQFEPEHLFLGLYNRSRYGDNNPRTEGNLFRLAVVGAFLAESGNTLNDWEVVSARIVRDPSAMLEQYREEGLDDFSEEDVRSLLSLDALFLACFLSKYFGVDSFPSFGYVVEEGSTSFNDRLLFDIVKLENQIPLLLLRNALLLLCETFREMRTENRQESSNNELLMSNADELLRWICTSVATCFRHNLPGHNLDASQLAEELKPNFANECQHLLHCVHFGMVSVGTLKPTQAPALKADSRFCGSFQKWCFRPQHELESSQRYASGRAGEPAKKSGLASEPLLNVPLASVTQLMKAGIKFRGHAGFKVKFERHIFGATLHLPAISYFGDSCEPLWRNLLAFEDEYQLGYQCMSYLYFMDDLIDSEEDVEVLRSGNHPVFINVGVGSNAEVVRLFNTITKGHLVNLNEKWQSVRAEILEYYNNEFRHMWVEFRTTNLGKPWLFASFIAAIVLLLLTVVQTVFTVLTY